MMDDKDRPEWRELEREVAAVYRALGYTVTEDDLATGNQIDLTARKYAGGATTFIVAIEVKYRSSGSVSLAEVNKFKVVAQSLLNDGTINAAAIISNASVTPKGKVALGSERRLHAATMKNYDATSCITRRSCATT